MKRLFDVVCAALLAIPATIVVVLVAPFVRAKFQGSAIFRQQRVGRGEQPFCCYKLRTLHVDAPSVASHELPQSYVTKLGTFLRRFKLDELPQVFNVLRGDMSFVGPRPCLPSQTQLIEERRVRGVYAVRPGITGAAQVAGIDMSDPVRLAKADAAYLERASFWMDLKILADTVLSVSEGRQVRRSGGRT